MRSVFHRFKQETINPPLTYSTPDGDTVKSTPPEIDVDDAEITPSVLIDVCQKHTRRVGVLRAVKQNGIDPTGYTTILASGLFKGGPMTEVGAEDLCETQSLNNAIITYLEQETFSDEEMVKSILSKLITQIPVLVRKEIISPDTDFQKTVKTLVTALGKDHPDITKYIGVHPQQLAYRASLIRRLADTVSQAAMTIPKDGVTDPQIVGKWISSLKTSILNIIGNEMVSENVPPMPIMHDHQIIDWISFKPLTPMTAQDAPLPSSAVVGSICNEMCNAADKFRKVSETLTDMFTTAQKDYKVDTTTVDALRPDEYLQLLAVAYHLFCKVVDVWYLPTLMGIQSSFLSMTQILTKTEKT